MQLAEFFVVFIVIFGKICESKIKIKIKELDGSPELEDAALYILTTCDVNQHKTVALSGTFAGNFIKRLSSNEAISLVLFHDLKKTEGYRKRDDVSKYGKQRADVLIVTADYYRRSSDLIWRYLSSVYRNSSASVIILKGSPENKHGSCNTVLEILNILFNANCNYMLNVNLLCHEPLREIAIHTINPFVPLAPEPWELVQHPYKGCHLFKRKYRKNREVCVKLEYDKGRDMGGQAIPVVLHFDTGSHFKEVCPTNPFQLSPARRMRIEQIKHTTLIDGFVKYVNATKLNLWYRSLGTRVDGMYHQRRFFAKPAPLMDLPSISTTSYPVHIQCRFLVTQFRGYKTQLQKILCVIDRRSWTGLFFAYLITLIFFKCLMRQSLIVGILNICRLSVSAGLSRPPPNVAPRIYLGGLLFVVVTMQGVFIGNLASMLTHDFPVRQVNSIQDLADLGYTVYVLRSRDLYHFQDPVFKNRVIFREHGDNCIDKVLQNSSIACLTWGSQTKEYVINHENLHISDNCFTTDYTANIIPWNWYEQDRFNKYLGLMQGASTLMPSLKALVDEKILHEKDSEEVLLEPEVMTLSDLGFAFAILGIGLACASITFILEITVHRYYRRLKRTRVIVVNRRGSA